MAKNTLLTVGIILSIIILLNGINSLNDVKQKIPLLGCADYNYQVEFIGGELPVEMDFYIVNPDGTEEYFKKDFAYDREESTLLHCGHDYKVIYHFKDRKNFVDYISIPEYNPLIIKTTKIQIQ